MVMKEVTVPMVSREQCQTWLRNTKLGQRFRLHSSLLCAGGEEGKDTCRGDGGGPLVCPQNPANTTHTVYTQVGIVAFGVGCGEQEVPGVYTSVAEQVCWLDWVLGCDPEYRDRHELSHNLACNQWLEEKQNHRFPPVRNIYSGCSLTWGLTKTEKFSAGGY